MYHPEAVDALQAGVRPAPAQVAWPLPTRLSGPYDPLVPAS